MYTIGKLVLRFYKKPPNFNPYINKIFNMIIVYGIIIHLCVGIWIYGNLDLILNRNKIALNQVDSYFQIANTTLGGLGNILYMKINSIPILIMLGVLVALVSALIIKYFVLDFFLIFCGNCCKKRVERVDTNYKEIGNGIFYVK